MPQRKKTVVTANQGTEKRLYGFLLLILLVLAALSWLYMSSREVSAAKTAPSTVGDLVLNVIPLQKQDVSVTSKYIGYVTPIKSVDVVPNISGYLEKIWVEGGREVTAGDNLVMIRQNEYKARLDAAKAAVVKAQADLDNAAVYYKRVRNVGSKAVSKTEFDNAKAQFLAARGTLSEARANQELAQVNYDYTLLQAPISGVVGNVDLTKGNYVSPQSSPLLKIIQYDPIRVVFSMTDKEYLAETAANPQELFAGESIKLQLPGGYLYPHSGQFRFTANEIDRTTNSIAVYADFANPGHHLVANAYVDVMLERLYKGAYLVNQKYVSLTPEGYFAYIVKDNRLVRTSLRIAAVQGDNYVVTNSFGRGYLVTDKVGTVAPGRKIRIKVASADKGD